MKRGTKTKKGGRYAEPWVPVQEGRDKLAWLDRGNSAEPEVTGLGVSNRKSDDPGDRWFFEGESLKCQGLFQQARAWRFF
jgi:hypothetical protein